MVDILASLCNTFDFEFSVTKELGVIPLFV